MSYVLQKAKPHYRVHVATLRAAGSITRQEPRRRPGRSSGRCHSVLAVKRIGPDRHTAHPKPSLACEVGRAVDDVQIKAKDINGKILNSPSVGRRSGPDQNRRSCGAPVHGISAHGQSLPVVSVPRRREFRANKRA